MDRGVRGDYIQRNFKGTDDDLEYRKKVMTRDAKSRFYRSKADYYSARDRTVLEEFAMVQQSRPLTPPKRK